MTGPTQEMYRISEIVEMSCAKDKPLMLARVRRWFARDLLGFTAEDQRPTKAGAVGKLCHRRAHQLSGMIRLVEAGMTPRSAAMSAFGAHLGDGAALVAPTHQPSVDPTILLGQIDLLTKERDEWKAEALKQRLRAIAAEGHLRTIRERRAR